jgi:hypothetical protein
MPQDVYARKGNRPRRTVPPEEQKCYDFPLIVIHAMGGVCPRYNGSGGICRPMPTPVKPYTVDEQEAVDVYNEAINEGILGKLVKATGTTILPDKEGKA